MGKWKWNIESESVNQNKRKWREVCILGREIVSRLTGECRPVFRPTDEWSGRLSYIHNPQALGIIIIIISIIMIIKIIIIAFLIMIISLYYWWTQFQSSFFAVAFHNNSKI